MTTELISSEKYIESLERRLQRIKGTAKDGPEPTSKEMLRHLSAVKEAHMKQLTDANDMAFESNFCANMERIDEAPAVTFIQRKFYPERQAITVEELHSLVQNDTLQAVTKTLNEVADKEMECEAKNTLS